MKASTANGAVPDQAHYFASPLLNIAWNDHLMFAAPLCIPVPSYLRFGEFLNSVLPSLFGQHPDFTKIDWSRAQWSKNNEFWIPKSDKSLWDNGVRHKDVVCLKTPGLTGINCSSS
jgi:phenol/toluene 2-monooxygenase (NADH) P4/A4